MDGLRETIAARLEAAFERRGFAEPGVAELRAAADVSLRTLYRHFPSRDAMMLAALERRHTRYLAFVFDGLPGEGDAALEAAFARVGDWMEGSAAKGCLFLAAVAAKPESGELAALLARHKAEVAARLASASGLAGREAELAVIHEGLTATHAHMGPAAVHAAVRLARTLRTASD